MTLNQKESLKKIAKGKLLYSVAY